jgi:hypothetical protein
VNILSIAHFTHTPENFRILTINQRGENNQSIAVVYALNLREFT